MSGIEIAGLVLGSFPILLNCLEYYREGFEPLEEWWNFRTHFIAFVDDISHQMMRYNENMIRLLDPIIVDNESLTTLIRNPTDSRWTDGSLDVQLQLRLSNQHSRFLRIVKRMEDVVRDLKKLLRIKESGVHWVGTEEERPWEWHLTRVRISFSKGKIKKVRTLATHNQELQEILGYSERIVPISDSRKPSNPVAHLEKIRQHACATHDALKRNWQCARQDCRSHQAHLKLQARNKTVAINVLFILDGQGDSELKLLKQEVTVQQATDKASSPTMRAQISDIQHAASFTEVQEQFEDVSISKKGSSISKLLSKRAKAASAAPRAGIQITNVDKKRQKVARFTEPIPKITISQDVAVNDTGRNAPESSHSPGQNIGDLCSSLRASHDPYMGVINDGSDNHFELFKSREPDSQRPVLETAELIPLSKLLDAYHSAQIEMHRQCRFVMAFHIASALLQVRSSPWLSDRYSKHDFYILADSQSVYSDHPYTFGSFDPTTQDPHDPPDEHLILPSSSVSEEDTRNSLFGVGVLILELIFGHSIETCNFRHLFYGTDNQPNEQTDISTARKWAKKVLGECGAEIDDVVRRCLDCSFGPRPSFKDVRSREAVYEGVIRPLGDYCKSWPEVIR